MGKTIDTSVNGRRDIPELVRPPADFPLEAGTRDRAATGATHAPGGVPAEIATGTTPAIETQLAGVRTLGLKIATPSPLLPFEDSQWHASEQYRVLRTKIVQHPKRPRLIVISSPAPADGKSVSAINLAAALSLKVEDRVLLVDADFRKSAVHAQLGLPGTPGLADVLSGACRPETALIHTSDLPNLYVIGAGTAPSNPVELLDSSQWREVCGRFRSLFAYVIVDSPPVAAVADFDLIQAPCDGVVLVVRPDHTPRQLLRRSLEVVPKEKLLGVLLNCVPDEFLARGTSDAYYYYYKGYAPREERARAATA